MAAQLLKIESLLVTIYVPTKVGRQKSADKSRLSSAYAARDKVGPRRRILNQRTAAGIWVGSYVLSPISVTNSNPNVEPKAFQFQARGEAQSGRASSPQASSGGV